MQDAIKHYHTRVDYVSKYNPYGMVSSYIFSSQADYVLPLKKSTTAKVYSGDFLLNYVNIGNEVFSWVFLFIPNYLDIDNTKASLKLSYKYPLGLKFYSDIIP